VPAGSVGGPHASVAGVPAERLHSAQLIPWRILLVCLLASVFSNLNQSLFGYAVPNVMRDLQVDISGIGLMISISFAISVIAVPLIASQVARLGAPAVLTLTVGSSALLVGLLGLAPNVGAFSLLRVTGFAVSMAVVPIASAYLARFSPDRGRALIMAALQCGYPLGSFIAATIAAPLLIAQGWRSTFLVAFAVVPLSGLILWCLPKARAQRVPTTDLLLQAAVTARAPAAVRPATAAALMTPGLRRLTLTYAVAFFLYGGGVGGVGFYLPTFFQQTRGYDAATATHVVGYSYAVAMIGYLGAAIVSEVWLSRRTTVVLWVLTAGVTLLATIWLPHSVLQDTVTFAITSIFLFGSSSILITSLLDDFPKRLHTIAAATLCTACISGGLVVFPVLIASAVAIVGWAMSLTLILVPALLAAGLLIASLPTRRPYPET
jgi:MFS family permease